MVPYTPIPLDLAALAKLDVNTTALSTAHWGRYQALPSCRACLLGDGRLFATKPTGLQPDGSTFQWFLISSNPRHPLPGLASTLYLCFEQLAKVMATVEPEELPDWSRANDPYLEGARYMAAGFDITPSREFAERARQQFKRAFDACQTALVEQGFITVEPLSK